MLAGAVLLLAGCSSGTTSADPAPARSRSASPSPSPTPTVPPYGPILARWIGPLDAAVARLPQAVGDLTAFGVALEDVRSKAAAAGTGLEAAQEPPAVSVAHRQLLVALDSLAAHVATVQKEVRDRSLCASSAALARFGEAQALTTIPAALRTLSAAGYPATLTVPDTGRLQQRSLDNGTLVREGSLDGRGELSIQNGGSSDAVLSLALGGKSAHSIFVAKGQTAKLEGVEDGTYDVYFAGGTDWDAATNAFTQSCDFSKFDDPMEFTTTRTSTQIEWSTWTLTLQPTVGGNAKTSDVPEGSYPLP